MKTDDKVQAAIDYLRSECAAGDAYNCRCVETKEAVEVLTAEIERLTPKLLEGQLSHGMNCSALTPGHDDDCTCGLKWRISLQTEQTMSSAWRKRAEEAEQQLERRKLTDFL